MNFYQKNNTSIRFTSIQIVNINFTQVVIDSNINNLLSSLKVSFSELEGLLKFKASSDDIKRKAIKANSIVGVLMDSVNEVEINYRAEFSKKLIESCALIIERFDSVEGNLEFVEGLRNELASKCISFFESQLGGRLNDRFWFDLKYYEWLLKEGFISRNHIYNQGGDGYFSAKLLEEFFEENRNEILRRMLNENRDCNGNLDVASPLNDNRVHISFQAYKVLPQKK